MKVREFIKNLNEMTDEELVKEEKDLKSELFKLRFQTVTNQLENPLKLREIKRSIARVKTAVKDREIRKLKEEGKHISLSNKSRSKRKA
ncbi:MAG: 50S ribosomal protein L29 [Clostridiales bacterium]